MAERRGWMEWVVCSFLYSWGLQDVNRDFDDTSMPPISWHARATSPNDTSSTTPPTRRHDGHRSAMAASPQRIDGCCGHWDKTVMMRHWSLSFRCLVA